MRNLHSIGLIQKWIKEGEGSRLDFKTKISSRLKIAKNLVAFANSRGGKLVVGVEDKGFVVGVDYEGEKFELEKAAEQFCTPRIRLRFSKLQHQYKTILIAEVPESNTKPHFVIDKNKQKQLYVRFADACVTPPPAIQQMLERGELNGLKRTHDYEIAKKNLLEFLILNKNLTVEKWAEHRNISQQNAKRFLVDILLEGCITVKVKTQELTFNLT